MRTEVQAGKASVKTLVCFALEVEAVPFRKRALKTPGVAILVTGIGPRNAENSLRRFLENTRPEQVLTCGFAGGLNPELKSGEVVFMTASAPLEARLLAAGAQPATFYSAPRIATTVAEKRQLREQTGADVVEMESGAILAVCHESQIPCALARAISDTAHEDLPLDFNLLSKPDLSLDSGKLAWAIAKAPWKIAALIQLQKKTSRAARQLADMLVKVLG